MKNAGATCYMNSVIQQLFMVRTIRLGVLQATGSCNDVNEDFSGEIDSKLVRKFILKKYIFKFNIDYF